MQHKRCGTGFAALAASALFITACSNATTDSQSSPSAASSDAAHNDAAVTIDAGQTYAQDDDIGIEVARDGDRVDAVAGHDRLELLAF